MPKVVAALGRFIPGHRGADRVPERLAGATAGGAAARLEFRERVLDRIEAGTVCREAPPLGADGFTGLAPPPAACDTPGCP